MVTGVVVDKNNYIWGIGASVSPDIFIWNPNNATGYVQECSGNDLDGYIFKADSEGEYFSKS